MPGICKTKEKYIDDGFIFIERPDGTVALFDDSNNPVNDHETKPCCELLGYTFDIENQKCRWVPNINSDELFKVVLNPDGNSSTLFEVEENETCSLEVSFDYLFLFKCDDLITAKAKAIGIQETTTSGGVIISAISNQLTFDNIEANISTLTSERDFYQSLVDAPIPPFVLECSDGGASDPSSFFGASSETPWLLTPGVVNYCLTPEGVVEWKSILDAKDLTYYNIWYTSNGTNITTYDCTDINNLLTANETSTDPLIEESCNYTIFDKDIALTTKQDNQVILDDIIEKLEVEEDKLETFKTEMGLTSPDGDIVTDTNCDEYINILENFDTSFSVEVLSPDGTALNTVYEEELINIGSGNLYNYIDSTSGKTGILISGDTRLMPTVEETELFGLPDDLCSQVRDTLVTDIFDEYLVDNLFPNTEVEKRNLYKKLTGWYQSSWLQYKTVITDESVISLLENKEVNISVPINNTCVNFSILLDRIKMNKICTKVDNVKRFISEPPKFELTKTPDNQKSWAANTTRDYRYSNLKYRGTEYNTNHHKLVVNTKEVDLTLSPSRAVEQDVWCYVSDNNCILEGCISSGETYSAFTCPSGYALDIDGNSCTKLTTTGVTTSAITHTVGAGVGLTKSVHSLSRGTIFIEDITDKTWPIYWTGTTKDSWVGPYYNVDYLVDYSGNYLNHTGFGSNTFTDGSIQYASPNAFSGIKSEYGKNNSSIYGGKLNPNILWGGTDGSVSGTPYVNISNTDNAGRLLNASIWSTGLTPTNEWIGVSYCFELTETKVYRLGFAGDDDVRIKVNGNYIFNSVITPSHDINIYKNFSESYSRTAQSYLVVGISLPAGKNIIEVEGYNTILGVSGFVLEVYDATEAELKNMRYETELNSVRVFSTADRIGQTFDLGEQSANSCPTGYAYDNCNPGSTSCLLIERTFRKAQQLDEYCPCPTYPLIVKDYSGTTTELPLTASTTTLNCDDIITLVSNYDTTTTLKDVEVIKGGSAYALGTETTTTFNGFWITEENDGTVGLYDVDYISGTSNNYENVSSQITYGCCKAIDDAFTAYTETFKQGVDTYPSISWDNNKKKCVYRKCGDNGCIDLDDVLTTELSAIDTVKEFASTLSSELIDAKNRKTLNGYPTLRMLYDRYNTRSEEFCGNLSSKYDYFDMDKFGKTVGNYWIDLIEQVVPATTIWGSTYAYKNTVFDQQKFNYRHSNIYFGNPPIPETVITPAETFDSFDFVEIEYKWNKYVSSTDTSGAPIYANPDLDTRTIIRGSTDSDINDEFIGFNNPNTVPTLPLASVILDTASGGKVINVTKINSGANYTSTPTVTILDSGGANYTSPPTVTITEGGVEELTATATIDSGEVNSILITTFGVGYTSAPTVTITGGGGVLATATATISNIFNISLSTGGAGYTSIPTVTITGGGGSGALATALVNLATGKVSNVFISDYGSGYSSAPTATISGGGGSGALAEVTINISGFQVTNPGGGYSSAPTVTISGGGVRKATATATVSGGEVTGFVITDPGLGYTLIDSPPNVIINCVLATVSLTNPGAGYTSEPTVTITGGGGAGATATATIDVGTGQVTGFVITGPGANYTSAPTVTISGGGGAGATATATITGGGGVGALAVLAINAGTKEVSSITLPGGSGALATATVNPSTEKVIDITVTNSGAGYTFIPTVLITGGGGAGATASINEYYDLGYEIQSITVNNPGHNISVPPTIKIAGSSGAGYTSIPTVTINGGGGAGATATATIDVGTGEVTGFAITNSGSGYTSKPTVTISGGGAVLKTASATATLNTNGEVASVTLKSGAGATATATISGGEITSIGVDTPGSGYPRFPSPKVIIPSNPYLEWGGDCTSCTSNSEHVLVDFKQLAADVTGTDIFKIELGAFWCSGYPAMIAAGVVPNLTINMKTYIDGTMAKGGPDNLSFVFTPTPGSGGGMVDNKSFDTQVHTTSGDIGGCSSPTHIPELVLGYIEYNKTTKEAVLIDASVSSDVTVISTTASLSPPTSPLLYAASASTVGVIIEELPKPITTTEGIFTIPPSIVRTEGVWIKETGSESIFLGEVTTIDKDGAIIPS